MAKGRVVKGFRWGRRQHGKDGGWAPRALLERRRWLALTMLRARAAATERGASLGGGGPRGRGDCGFAVLQRRRVVGLHGVVWVLSFRSSILLFTGYRGAACARQLAQKRKKGDSELSAEREHVNHPRGMQLSGDDSGMIKMGEEEGSDALKTKKDKHELSFWVRSMKMKPKRVQLPSEGKTRKDGKSRKRH